MHVLPGLCVYWNVEIGVLEVYGCYPFCILREVLIFSSVFILNFSVFRNLFRVLRSKIGPHLLFDLGTKNSQLKKLKDF